MPETPTTIVAVTGEDDRYAAVRSRATALAAGRQGTVVLYDLDAAGTFASPVPTEWSGEGERELTDEEAGPEERMDADALDAAGRSAVGDQVRQLRSMGVDAWGWLPTTKDAADLAAYAARQGASVVLVPPDLAPPAPADEAAGGTDRPEPVPFEVVEAPAEAEAST